MALQRVETRRIQMWLGHKNIQNTVIYTQIAGTEINDIPDTIFRPGTY
jgi:site-specific recombinase XerD